MGETGPCGPCSEIFFDHGEHIPGGVPGSPDEDGDRFVEIWNLVFMQFEQFAGDRRVDLPRPSVDTGMGLERISAILQGKHDNYDIDLFQALIAASVEITGVPATGKHAASHRVIADHLRATSFLIADGVLPANEGRGYVLRRIMRRAMRHANLLGADDPLLHKLVEALIVQMGAAYPELVRAQTLISDCLNLEEIRFRKTLKHGLSLLDEATQTMGEGAILDGETAFKLYDTYGFPLDLTEDALRRRNISVDCDGFAAAMERQKIKARASWTGTGEAADDAVWFAIRDEFGRSKFLGYEVEITQGLVQAMVHDGVRVFEAFVGQNIHIIVNRTPFYGSSGGQLGDCGKIRFDGGYAIVKDTQKMADGVLLHCAEIIAGALHIGMKIELEVDHERRARLCVHHSATHLLHESMRQVLGPHVTQKGSLVAPDRLRFDFSHPKAMTRQEMVSVEVIANEIILQSAPVSTRIMAVDDAIAAGAMALFGEKYGDEVRVVSMGTAMRGKKSGEIYSSELCGGTHVANTGEIGMIKLINEGAVASGVRRIEAVGGVCAHAHSREQDERVQEMASLLKIPPNRLVERVKILISERGKLDRELLDARKKLAFSGNSPQDAQKGVQIHKIAGIQFLGQVIEGINMRDLKGLADESRAMIDSGVVAIVALSQEGKAGIVVSVSQDLTDRFDAVHLVRIGSEMVGGKGGGGRPDMAQAGGPNGQGAEKAIKAIENYLKSNA